MAMYALNMCIFRSCYVSLPEDTSFNHPHSYESSTESDPSAKNLPSRAIAWGFPTAGDLWNKGVGCYTWNISAKTIWKVAEEKPQGLCHHLVWGTFTWQQSLCRCATATVKRCIGLCQEPLAPVLSPDAENSTFQEPINDLFFCWFPSCLRCLLLISHNELPMNWRNPPFPDTSIGTIVLRISHCFHTIANKICLKFKWLVSIPYI